MCKYKGNDGNLMQHWTLCEMLTVAQRRGPSSLRSTRFWRRAALTWPP